MRQRVARRADGARSAETEAGRQRGRRWRWRGAACLGEAGRGSGHVRFFLLLRSQIRDFSRSEHWFCSRRVVADVPSGASGRRVMRCVISSASLQVLTMAGAQARVRRYTDRRTQRETQTETQSDTQSENDRDRPAYPLCPACSVRTACSHALRVRSVTSGLAHVRQPATSTAETAPHASKPQPQTHRRRAIAGPARAWCSRSTQPRATPHASAPAATGRARTLPATPSSAPSEVCRDAVESRQWQGQLCGVLAFGVCACVRVCVCV